jgi:hypothetical protein
MGKKVEIPEKLYRKIVKSAGKDKAEKAVVKFLQEYLELKEKRAKDPFFKKLKTYRSGLSDVSEKHDDYLYGDKSK